MGVGGWGWVESRIRLISAETETLLGLAELGKKAYNIWCTFLETTDPDCVKLMQYCSYGLIQ